ncbi:MAG: response regulator, partial [Magnetococcales bacterium]|nr:response regulator [Magnetococcales bacterium]
MDALLLVEDSKSFGSLVQSRIQAALPIEAVLGDSFAQAETLLNQNPGRFFLAVLDLNLPDAPNGEIVDLVLAQGIPVFVLTGIYRPDLQRDLLDRGVLDYFIKDNAGVINAVIHAIDRIRKNRGVPVLVVDDSAAARQEIAGFLGRYGFRPLLAENGSQAMAVVARHDIHLVICDYDMPEMDGIRFVKGLREQRQRDDVAVIGFSSLDRPDLPVEFIKAGANDFLFKPFQ